MSYDLAQVNIARLADDLDSPGLMDFVNALDPVNAMADIAPGFVWRLQTEDGNATSVAGFAANLACWWVPAGHRPTVAEAEYRVALLRRHGPTPASFTLRRHFPAPGLSGSSRAIEREGWTCGV